MRIARYTTGEDPSVRRRRRRRRRPGIPVDGRGRSPRSPGDPLYQPAIQLTGERGAAGRRAAAGAGASRAARSIGIGKNYADHAAEMGGEAAGRAADVPQPQHRGRRPRRPDRAARAQTSEVHYEGELAVVIGRICKDVPPERRPGRDLRLHLRQRRHRARPAARRRAVGAGQGLRHVLPARARGSRPTSTPRTLPLVDAPRRRGRPGRHDRRHGHDVAALVSHASQAFTLLPGDVILTGTPGGRRPRRQAASGSRSRSRASASCPTPSCAAEGPLSGSSRPARPGYAVGARLPGIRRLRPGS